MWFLEKEECMGKKLASLVLVLALAGVASAIGWIGPPPPEPPGAWENPANWNESRVPVATDDVLFYRNDGLTAQGTISSNASGGIKLEMKLGNSWLKINSGGSLSVDGSFEQGCSGAAGSSIVIIDTGALLDVAKKVTVTTGTWKIGSASPTATTHTVNIYGTARVKGSLATSDVVVGYAGGNAVVNLYGGGLLDVDAYSINATKGIIKMWQGATMRDKG